MCVIANVSQISAQKTYKINIPSDLTDRLRTVSVRTKKATSLRSMRMESFKHYVQALLTQWS